MRRIADDVSAIIKEHINDKQYTFVFNSEIASASWALWCIKNTECKAIDLQRFIAWDEFARMFAAPQGKTEVDGTIRRLFASVLIKENAASPFLETVVPKPFASDARYLAPSIAKRLPALNMLKKLSGDTAFDSEEIRDYKKIYDRYVSFMESNNLFEKSWQDLTSSSARQFVLFYPAIIEDWVQYKDLLSCMDNITVVELPDGFLNKRPIARLYPNARMELRKTALYIRELLDSGLDACDIALTVPGIATLRPYVERELRLYDIPFVTHIAQPLSSSGIGKMFRAIYDCYSTDFSLSSVRTLLQSCSVPWRAYNADGTTIDWATELVRIGSEMRCLCHWEDGKRDIDPWKIVLKDAKLERERVWYDALKSAVTSFVLSKSFAQMRQVWFKKWRIDGLLDEAAFEEKSGKYDKDADVILSRCITALYKLERLEQQLGGTLKITNRYEFFLEELKSTLYTPQQEERGVNIFDYKVAACGAYKHNIIINASQANVTTSFKTLDFLSEQCRNELLPNGMSEVLDVSKEYLALYSADMGARGITEISSSSNGFAGFSTPHSFLSIARNGKECDTQPALDEKDFVTKEREYFARGECAPVISERQAKEINEWARRLPHTGKADGEDKKDSPALPPAPLMEAVFKTLKVKSGESVSPSNPVQISATSMNKFFPCARKWLLNNALKLQDEETFDTDLMPDYSTGNILHKILEIICGGYMERKEMLPIVTADGTFGEAEEAVQSEVKKAAVKAIMMSASQSHSLSSMPLVSRALELQADGYVRRVMSFLHKACKEDERGKDGTVSKYFIGGKYVKGVEVEKSLQDNSASYKMMGRIDCLLETEQGDNIIIDYKSSTPPDAKASTVSDDGEIADFQMPVYVALMEGNVEGASFLHISSGEYKRVLSSKCTASDYVPTTERLCEYAEHFAQRVKNMDFLPSDKSPGFLPLNVWKNCPPCPFNSICRKTYSTSRD